MTPSKLFKLFTGAVTLKILIFSLYRLKHYQHSNAQKKQKEFIIEQLKKSEFEVNSPHQENLLYLCQLNVKNQDDSNLLTFLSHYNFTYKHIDFKIKKVTLLNHKSSLIYNLMGFDYENCYYEIHVNINNCVMQMIEPNEFVNKILDLLNIHEKVDTNINATQIYQSQFTHL